MNSVEFITLAGRIAGQCGPAGARSAASRAYYGVFHLAKDVLVEIGCPPGSDNHGLVRQLIKSIELPEAKKAWSLLDDLHGERIKADYKLSDTTAETLNFAQIAVESAEEAKRNLLSIRSTCSNAQARARHRAEIEKYRKSTNQQ